MEDEYLDLFDEFLDAIATKKSGISDEDYEAIHKIFNKYLEENNHGK